MRDNGKLSRRCIVQSEWVEQSVKAGMRLEGGDKGGWEIKYENILSRLLGHYMVNGLLTVHRVINDRIGVEANMAADMPDSIVLEPRGGTPMLSLDLHQGTVPGGLAPGEDEWTYRPRSETPGPGPHVLRAGVSTHYRLLQTTNLLPPRPSLRAYSAATSYYL